MPKGIDGSVTNSSRSAAPVPRCNLAHEFPPHDARLELRSQQFLKQLEIEKRRADRTKSPVSLLVVEMKPERGGDLRAFNDAMDVLTRSKRETDVLGYVGRNRVALILPHTNEQGVRAFIRNIGLSSGSLPVTVAFGTYPDQLFSSLAAQAADSSDTCEYLFAEQCGFSRPAALVKRVMDVVGALCGILVFAPVMIAVAIAIASTSRGGVIFRQTRIGKGGVPFTCYKFRSMRVDVDDRIHREYVSNLIDGNLDRVNQGEALRPLYKLRADPRVTRVGRVVRSTSLDELPQFFNVLMGDMSLVGPRPPLPYEVEKYQSWHLRRVLQVRPGITGLWQVEGRSKTSFDDMVRLDLRYIRSGSLWLDVKILLKTVAVVLRRDGAS